MFSQSTRIQMLPPGGSICGILTQDLSLGCLQGGEYSIRDSCWRSFPLSSLNMKNPRRRICEAACVYPCTTYTTTRHTAPHMPGSSSQRCPVIRLFTGVPHLQVNTTP